MKNIILCCDGTNNKLEGDLTNVARLSQIAIQDESQRVFYDPGVGTMADPAARGPMAKRWSLVKGLAFGAGFQQNVFDAYSYLMREYQPGDRVFLFGFSRGAFTARVVAGMLHGVGLLNAGSEKLLPSVWEKYRAIRILPPEATAAERAAAQRHDEEVKALRHESTKPCTVAFLGPWDTVGSVGMYNWNQAYPFTFENGSVEMTRHAVSLDERRAGFRSNVFKADPTPLPGSNRPRVMNVWFPGVHSDIGGGYAWPGESGLAMIAFQWMVREARTAGLRVDDSKLTSLLTQCPPNASADMHVSLKGGWNAMEYLPARRFDWKKKKTIWRYDPKKPRTMIESPFLHQCIHDRMAARNDYRPVNLPPNHGYPTEA